MRRLAQQKPPKAWLLRPSATSNIATLEEPNERDARELAGRPWDPPPDPAGDIGVFSAPAHQDGERTRERQPYNVDAFATGV
jgi:hypothetical protein